MTHELRSPRNWSFDLGAGLTVAIVALPLALGFGVTSGMGAGAGLVTAIVAGFIAGALGGSNYQVSGPTGAMVVVLVPIVTHYGVEAMVAVGMLAGVLLVAMALLRLGRLAESIPWSVMEGFTLGIAVIIALQQLPIVFEVPRGEGSESLEIAWNTAMNISLEPLHLWSIGIVAATLGIKAIWRFLGSRRASLTRVPASAVGVLLTTVLVWGFNIPVSTIGSLPTGEIFTLDLSWPDMAVASLLWSALVVAILAAVESLLAARVADAMVKRRDVDPPASHQPNRELFGQGVATFFSSMVGGMPATGAIARTAVNVHAGARTRLAAISHAVILLIVLLTLAPLVSQIPTAALAGVLLGTSWRIANPASVAENLRATWPEVLSYLVTAVAVVSIDLIWGTTIGIVTHAVATRVASVIERSR